MHLLDDVPKSKHGLIYATEADLINFIVFGETHKNWAKANPNAKGNQRDYGTTLDNALIANLEFQNSLLIQQGHNQEQCNGQVKSDNAIERLWYFSSKELGDKYPSLECSRT